MDRTVFRAPPSPGEAHNRASAMSKVEKAGLLTPWVLGDHRQKYSRMSLEARLFMFEIGRHEDLGYAHFSTHHHRIDATISKRAHRFSGKRQSSQRSLKDPFVTPPLKLSPAESCKCACISALLIPAMPLYSDSGLNGSTCNQRGAAMSLSSHGCSSCMYY